ncbi:MAG: hypothetical protein ABI140_15780 [Jatrophihabitantaceae bacterium]
MSFSLFWTTIHRSIAAGEVSCCSGWQLGAGRVRADPPIRALTCRGPDG